MTIVCSQRLLLHFDAPSTSGRLDDRRVSGMRSLQRPVGLGSSRFVRDVPAARAVVCEATRPPAGPSSILCSSLSKERKKLAKLLKSHRKVLEKRLSALTRAEADSPVLSELLIELRALTSRLDSQRAVALFNQMGDSDSSSDSDDDDGCITRSAMALCTRRAASVQEQPLNRTMQPVASEATPHSLAPGASASPSKDSASTRMVVSTLTGEIELPVPAPEEGWDWNENEFRAAKFEGAGGRIMVCTGSKCQRKGATEVLRAVEALSEGNPNIEVVPCKCVGKCSAGAALRVRPLGQPCTTYTQVRPSQLRDVFMESFAALPVPPALEPPGCGIDPAHSHSHVTCCAECQG